MEVSKINGYDIKDKKSVRTYDTVAAMKIDGNLKEGQHVKTRGYYEINDGGSAEYYITDTESLTDYQEELNSGLYATLIIDKVNLKQLGANGTVTNDTKALQLFADSNLSTLYIPEGTYYLNDIVDLENKELIGVGNPIININGITTSREHTIHVAGSCHIKGINFIQTIAETNIMGLFSANNTLIENCSFKVDDVKCNGYFDLYTDNHNIRVLNCDFDCVSTETVEDVKVNAIGGIWVRQFQNDYTSDNIIFENCNISHQSKDEGIAVWNDRTPILLSNVQLNNCIIKAKDGATCPHLVTFNATNSSINNCIIERLQTDTTSKSSIIRQSQSYGVPININNCVINTNIKHTSAIFNTGKCTINNCEINDSCDETRLLNNNSTMKNSIINCNSFQNQYTGCTLENCKININAQTHSWLFRHTCNLLNNVFNFATANPTQIIYCLSDENANTFFLDGNIFNYYNNGSPYLINMENRTVNNLYAFNNIRIGQILNASTNNGIVANNITLVSLNVFDNIKTNNNFNINAE